jgi:uncharacterized SAM-binding protein YcdF (DUF218 family)
MSSNQRGGIIFRFLALLALLAFLGSIYLIRYPLLRLAGGFWVVQDPLEHVDAIVVLGDDNFAADRSGRAAELFRAGWAPEVVASGRMLRPYFGVAELIEHDLESRGVPASAVVRLDQRTSNRRRQAQALLALARQRHWSHLLLVTSNYRTRRIRYIFRRVLLPAEVSLGVIGVEDASFDPSNWWESRQGREIFFQEAISYCVATWELRDGASGAVPKSMPAEAPSRPAERAAPQSPIEASGG